MTERFVAKTFYKRFYAVSRLRGLSELPHLRNERYHDLWEGLMDSFRLFEDEAFGRLSASNHLVGYYSTKILALFTPMSDF